MVKIKLVVFDMDGTLTKPREKMEMKITFSLWELQKKGFKMSSCSDSIRAYLREQGKEICRETHGYSVHSL